MRRPPMPMRVRVPRRGGEAWVLMVVVAVVVSMAVDVLFGPVSVLVLMAVENEKHDAE